MATATVEEFNAKIEEVVGHLGVALGVLVAHGRGVQTASLPPEFSAPDVDDIRALWQRLGRSFAELMDMEPPR